MFKGRKECGCKGVEGPRLPGCRKGQQQAGQAQWRSNVQSPAPRHLKSLAGDLAFRQGDGT